MTETNYAYDADCEAFDDANPMNAAILDLMERLHALTEGLTRGDAYPNRDFDCGMLSGAQAILEGMLDPHWPKLKAMQERWIHERLYWAVTHGRPQGTSGAEDANTHYAPEAPTSKTGDEARQEGQADTSR